MKKNYKFIAYDSKGNEIKLRCANVFYGITKEQAVCITWGAQMGLLQKYKNVRVTFRELTEEERKEYEESFHKALGL